MFFDDKVVIGRIIKKYRKLRKVTQEALSEKVDISEKHLSKIETGVYYPSLSVFFSIVEQLEIPFEEFGLSEKNSKNDEIKEKVLKYMHTLNNDELEFVYSISKLCFESFKIKQR